MLVYKFKRFRKPRLFMVCKQDVSLLLSHSMAHDFVKEWQWWPLTTPNSSSFITQTYSFTYKKRICSIRSSFYIGLRGLQSRVRAIQINHNAITEMEFVIYATLRPNEQCMKYIQNVLRAVGQKNNIVLTTKVKLRELYEVD